MSSLRTMSEINCTAFPSFLHALSKGREPIKLVMEALTQLKRSLADYQCANSPLAPCEQ
jgi:hypothetical protein